MTTKEIEEKWNQVWGDQPNIEHLVSKFADYAFRINSLPDGKRYPDNHHEMDIILERNNQVLTRLRSKENQPLVVILTEWTGENIPPNLKPIHFGLRTSLSYWRTIQPDSKNDDPEFNSYAHKFISNVTQLDQLTDLFKMIADDKVSGTIIAPSDFQWLFHPYDGGVDVLVKDTNARKNLRKMFIDWIQF